MAEKIRIILLISFSKFCHLHCNELQTFVAALPDSLGLCLSALSLVAETGFLPSSLC